MCLKLFFWKKTPHVHKRRLEAEQNSPNILLYFPRGNTLNFQTVRNSGRRVIEWVLKEFPAKVQILSICKSSQEVLNAFDIKYSTYASPLLLLNPLLQIYSEAFQMRLRQESSA